jgi:hypothetical protein
MLFCQKNDVKLHGFIIGMMPYIYRTNPGDYNDLVINMNRANGSPSWWGEWRGIRTNRHTYAVQYYKGTVNKWLYDNDQDPFQMSPIHNEELFAEFDARVRKWLHPADPFSTLVGWE